MRKIGILPNAKKDSGLAATKTLIAALLQENCRPMLNENLNLPQSLRQYAIREDLLYREAEFLIVLGGDGTMLSSAKRAAKYNTPLMGVNMGHLGFLTAAGPDTMVESLQSVLRGEYQTEKRMMLRAEIFSSKEGKRTVTALNEVSISRGSMVDVEVKVNGDYIDDFFGDGILVATPTGSTAYNLAAGGPILKSDSNVLAITPICPHMLHARSIVIGGNDRVELIVKRFSRQKIFAVVDGQNICTLEEGDSISISKAKFFANIIKTGNTGFYDVLRNKLFGKGDR